MDRYKSWRRALPNWALFFVAILEFVLFCAVFVPAAIVAPWTWGWRGLLLWVAIVLTAVGANAVRERGL